MQVGKIAARCCLSYQDVMKYTFSGHESFTCKTLWLKKGYDFIINERNFNSADAVVCLGVGKNMVASIRYWLRVFALTENDKPTRIANYLFDSHSGKDPFIEDLGTLWLLHFLLVSRKEATLYNWLFVELQRERKKFDRQKIVNFVYRMMVEADKQSLFNENTIKKDIGVLLQSYVLPDKGSAFDDYASLLIDLDLICHVDDKNYSFNVEGKRQVPWQIFLYSILTLKGSDETVSYDLLQEIGLMFCMSDMEVIEMCRTIEENKPTYLKYSETAGIRQVQLIQKLNGEDILNEYYGKE